MSATVSASGTRQGSIPRSPAPLQGGPGGHTSPRGAQTGVSIHLDKGDSDPGPKAQPAVLSRSLGLPEPHVLTILVMVPQRCEDAPDSPYPSLWGAQRVVGLEKGRKTQGPRGRGSVGRDGAPEVSVEEVRDQV